MSERMRKAWEHRKAHDLPLGHRWTKEEIALLGTAIDREVGRKLGQTEVAVRAKREYMGIPPFSPAGPRKKSPGWESTLTARSPRRWDDQRTQSRISGYIAAFPHVAGRSLDPATLTEKRIDREASRRRPVWKPTRNWCILSPGWRPCHRRRQQ